jgi:hypothetical protein
MPAVLLLVSNGDHDARGFAPLEDGHDLVRLGLAEIRVQELITSVFRRLQNGSAPFFRPIDDPVLELPGNLAQHVAAYRIHLAVRVEEANHPLGLLEGLDQTVQQNSVEASIAELNVILVVLVKGVHGNLQCCRIPGAYARGRHPESPTPHTIGISRAKPLAS